MKHGLSCGSYRRAGLALTAYMLISHYASSLHPRMASFRGHCVAAYLAIAAVLAWRSRHRVAWLLYAPRLRRWRGDTSWPRRSRGVVYFIQHAGGNAVLALVFGALSSGTGAAVLRIGRHRAQSLGTEACPMTRGRLRWRGRSFLRPCRHIRRALRVRPVAIWSVFAIFSTLPLVALMFAVEYVRAASLLA